MMSVAKVVWGKRGGGGEIGLVKFMRCVYVWSACSVLGV